VPFLTKLSPCLVGIEACGVLLQPATFATGFCRRRFHSRGVKSKTNHAGWVETRSMMLRK
jgi:hypothetical protein